METMLPQTSDSKTETLDSSKVWHAVCQCQGLIPPSIALCGYVAVSQVRITPPPADQRCVVCVDLFELPRSCCGWSL